MKPNDPPSIEPLDSSGDEDLNQYSVMRKNISHIGLTSSVKKKPEHKDTVADDKMDEIFENQESPKEEKKKSVKFQDPQTTQEENENKMIKNKPRMSSRPTNFVSKNFGDLRFKWIILAMDRMLDL